MNNATLRQHIRNKYAWPGGYPMFLVTSDGAALCMECGRKEYRNIAWSRHHKSNDGWRVVDVNINYEDTTLYCDHCNETIEAAYADAVSEPNAE